MSNISGKKVESCSRKCRKIHEEMIYCRNVNIIGLEATRDPSSKSMLLICSAQIIYPIDASQRHMSFMYHLLFIQ